MNDEQISLHFQIIRQQIWALQGIDAEASQRIDTVLEDLQVSYEEMQTSLETSEATNQDLLQQNQQLTAAYFLYHDLFQSSPIASLVTDASGVILEANQETARLVNVPQPYIVGKPLAAFVTEDDLQAFYTKLNQLSPTSKKQQWQMRLSSWRRKPFEAQLHVEIAQHDTASIKALTIAVYDLSQDQQRVAQLSLDGQSTDLRTAEERSMLPLPQSLDGLRVLVVDDEPDIREFIIAVFESRGIGVKAVASAAAALAELERFRPDVLLSDIRMPGGDGYSLIRQIRALEAERGGHLPAAAITAYLDEDREKSLQAGFEAHLHKLAQPREWVEMITRLVEQATE